jgi:cytochrome P450
MLTQRHKDPPGPLNFGRWLGATWRHYFRLRWDPLKFVTDLNQKYGDLTFFQIFHKRAYLVNHPDLVHEVLVSKKHSFCKAPRQLRIQRQVFGDGLLMSQGELWLKQRRLLQKAFHSDHLPRFADMTVSLTRRRLDDWPEDAEINIADEMAELIAAISMKSQFGMEPSEETTRLSLAAMHASDAVVEESRALFAIPDWLPTNAKRKKMSAMRSAHRFVDQAIQERRQADLPQDDLLSLLLLATDDEDDDRGMSDLQARYEALTMLFASNGTTTVALSWTLYLLSQHPEVQRRLLLETAALGSDDPTYDDLQKLPYTDMVLKEAMRMYPPAWCLFSREAVEDVELGGYLLPKGSWALIFPWGTHRDARFFPDPLQFDPERFAPGRVEAMHPQAYFPFGMGPHVCIGARLAMVEMKLVLAMVMRRFELQPPRNSKPPRIEPHIVLWPKGGIWISLRQRTAANQAQMTG